MDEQTEALIAIYRAAYIELLQMIAAVESQGRIATWQRATLADIAQLLRNLDVTAREWIEQQFALAYLNGQTEAIRALVTLGAVPQGAVTAQLTGVHLSAVETLARQLFADLTDAHGVVGRRVDDLFRQAGVDAVTRKVTTGQLSKQAQASLRRTLADSGITAFTDARGRQWRLDTYAEMVIRSTTREATNLGRLTQQSQLGHDLVRMTVHHPTCPICAVYQGRVYSISGNDPRYPALYQTVLSHGYHTVHPNCGHSFAPYVEALASSPAADREASNEPFDVDPRTEAQREAYAAGQEDKRRRREDRYQWERFQAVLPNDTPPFSAFRSMKGADSERWHELQELYREVRELASSGV